MAQTQAASAAKAGASKGEPAKTSQSQEAFVVEQFSRKQKFENDGTSSQEDTERVRVQSEAGLQRFGLLTFSYASATGIFEIAYVRVRKADGTVVETPPENVQDMAAQITREAPFYSDLHEKHVAVKGLGVGDVLEFQTIEKTTKPLAPGEFWTSYAFSHQLVVLDEELEIRVPRDRAVKVKSNDLQPVVGEEGGYRVYRWKTTNLQAKDARGDKRQQTETAWQVAQGRQPGPDVEVSSFASWEEVGQWYGGLQADRVKPTPEVAAKAAELTKNATDEEAKIRALYGYVSTQFRYIGVAFGIGRYQAHGASEVLANQYGDCKDKHTLLAALLSATGIPAYPALISTTREVDADVPSPGQFDHVITVVPRGNELVWLDTTTEVGPYRYLVSPLLGKHALVIGKEGAALKETPAALPYPSVEKFHMDAKLSDTGVLEGQTDLWERGDLEFLMRAGFREVPLPQWKDLAQRISLASGFGGEVSEVTASSPEKTEEPFHVAYKYTRKEYGDWPNRRTLIPAPQITLPAPADDEMLPKGPLWLGPVKEVELEGEVTLPHGYRPVLPEAVHLKKDYAEYDATYAFEGGKLVGRRHLKTLLREVPASERDDYVQFMKKVQEDYGLFIALDSGTGGAVAAASSPSRETLSSLRELPNSLNVEAGQLESQARDEMSRRDLPDATSSLYRAVAADPKFTRAWVLLGGLLLMQNQVDAGVDAFRKAMASDPGQPAIPKVLGMSLMSASRFEEAVPVWQDFVKQYPNDLDGVANLGRCLMQLKRYPEAAAAFEAATKTNAQRAELQVGAASAYAMAGEREKAGAAYQKLGDMNPNAAVLNDAAYEMANADLQLPLARDYAKKAAQVAEEDSRKITLATLSTADLEQIQRLAAVWDTVGWVSARMTSLEEAEVYLRGAWMMTQDGTAGSHLCQVYEREHRWESAIEMCKMTMARIPLSQGVALSEASTIMDETRKRLDRLNHQAPGAKAHADGTDLVIRERTYKLPHFLTGTESAEFFVLLEADGKSKKFQVADVKFVSGSDKMKMQGKQLKAIAFDFPAPVGVEARFVRRGILGCYQYSGCSFVLLDPEAVKSVN